MRHHQSPKPFEPEHCGRILRMLYRRVRFHSRHFFESCEKSRIWLLINPILLMLISTVTLLVTALLLMSSLYLNDMPGMTKSARKHELDFDDPPVKEVSSYNSLPTVHMVTGMGYNLSCSDAIHQRLVIHYQVSLKRRSATNYDPDEIGPEVIGPDVMTKQPTKSDTIKSSALIIFIPNPTLLTDTEALIFLVITFGLAIIYAYLNESYDLDRCKDRLWRQGNGVSDLEEVVINFPKTKGKLKNVYPQSNELAYTSIQLKEDQLHAQSKLRCNVADIALLQVLLDEEQEANRLLSEDLAAAISKDALQKTKMDMEYLSKIKEATDAMKKLKYKLRNVDEAYSELQSKYFTLYRSRNSIAAELDELNLVMNTEKIKYLSLEKKELKVEGQIAVWMLNFAAKETEQNQYKNLLRKSAIERVKTRSLFENQPEALALSQKEYMLDGVTNSDEQFNEGEVTIQELARANNDFEVRINFTMEEAVTNLICENAGLQCVHFQTTQLTVVADHRVKEINPDSETAGNNKERQYAALHKSQDEVLKVMVEQFKQTLLDAKSTKMPLHVEDVENAISESSIWRRRCLGQLKEGKSLYEVEQKLHAELHATCSSDNKIASVHKLVVGDIRMNPVHTSFKTIRPYDERKSFFMNMFQGVLGLLMRRTPGPNHISA